MGDDNVGMKTTWMRNEDKTFMQAIMDRTASERMTNPRGVTETSEKMNAHVIASGWNDRETCHVMNAHQIWFGSIKSQINRKAFDKTGFIGNSGSCRFQKAFWDAHDVAFVGGADRMDCKAAGYQAMADHFGVDAPVWAWWN